MTFRTNSKPRVDIGLQADRPVTPGVDGLIYVSETGISVWDAEVAVWRVVGGGGAAVWGTITGTLSDQTDLSLALAEKASLASPALIGTPTVPTAVPGTGTTQIASTAFVEAAISAIPAPTAPAWGAITGTLANQTDLNDALALKAPLASPALTGVPTAPTALLGSNDTTLATTAFVQASARNGVQFVYDPNAPAPDYSRSLYNNWSTMCAAIATLPFGVVPIITFVRDCTLPSVGMPVTGWYMANAVWNSPVASTPLPGAGRITVTIPDGVMIDSFSQIDNGLYVTVAPSTDGVGVFNWTTFSSLYPGDAWTLRITNTSSLINTGTKAAIVTPGGPAIINLSILIEEAYFGGNPVTPAPFVRVVAPDRCLVTQRNCGFRGSLPINWLEGNGNLLKFYGVDAFDSQNAGFSGNILTPMATESAQNPITTRGSRRQLIFTDSAIGGGKPTYYSPDVFTDWALLYETWRYMEQTGICSTKDIVFVQTDVVPLVIPAAGMPVGGWVIGNGAVLLGPGISSGYTTVVIEDGAVLHDVTGIGGGLTLVGQSSAPCLTHSTALVSPYLIMDAGCVIRNDGAAPMIAWDRRLTPGAGVFRIGLREQARLATGNAPVLDVTPAGAFISAAQIFLYGGVIDDQTLASADAPGIPASARIVPMVSNGQFGMVHAGVTGTLPMSQVGVYTVLSRQRSVFQNAPITAGPYACSDGSEYIRVEPDGSGPVDITLPPASDFPCETITVKKINTDATTVITVSSTSLIDDSNSDTWPSTAFFSRRYTSDGTQWWVSDNGSLSGTAVILAGTSFVDVPLGAAAVLLPTSSAVVSLTGTAFDLTCTAVMSDTTVASTFLRIIGNAPATADTHVAYSIAR